MWGRPLWAGKTLEALGGKGSRGLFDCGNANDTNNDVCLAYFPQIPGVAATFDRIGADEHHGKTMPWSVDTWHHVAMTWHCNRGINLYWNGQAVMEKRSFGSRARSRRVSQLVLDARSRTPSTGSSMNSLSTTARSRKWRLAAT